VTTQDGGGEAAGVTAGDQRRVAVPEGLDGERLDAALARMFGLSRAAAAELISGGRVLVAGHPAAKSDRVPRESGSTLPCRRHPPP
jgi:23S rRNA pseudouridine1911/1915/1917 synthase